MPIAKRDLATALCEALGIRALLSRLRTWRGILTLNYHRIGDCQASPFDPELFSATIEQFDAQVQFLKTWCDLIVPSELGAALTQPRSRFVLITFDDGYADNFTNALPVLSAHGIRATFFLATGFLDRPRVPWWDEVAWMLDVDHPIVIHDFPFSRDPLRFDPASAGQGVRNLSRLYLEHQPSERQQYLDRIAEASGRGRTSPDDAQGLWMSWDMVRALKDAGMELGGHTHEHVLLSELSEDAQKREIDTCLRRIREETGVQARSLSYPHGFATSYNEATLRCLQSAGVEYAFMYQGGYQRFGEWDPYRIPRFGVERYQTRALFRLTVAAPSLLA